jgi:hypothetical protein
MTTRQVSDDLELYRVEINGLKNLDEANEVWQTGLNNQWLAFASNPGGNRSAARGDKISPRVTPP